MSAFLPDLGYTVNALFSYATFGRHRLQEEGGGEKTTKIFLKGEQLILEVLISIL